MVKMAITYLNVNNGEPESCENFIKEQIKKIPAFFLNIPLRVSFNILILKHKRYKTCLRRSC